MCDTTDLTAAAVVGRCLSAVSNEAKEADCGRTAYLRYPVEVGPRTALDLVSTWLRCRGRC